MVTFKPAGQVISGNLTASGGGATVKLSGPSNRSFSTTADANGNYLFSGLANGSYTVSASGAGADLSPLSQSVTVNGSNVIGLNFTATATPNPIFYDSFTAMSLNQAWTVISRHGEYAQNETECNTPSQVVQANGYLTITTIAQESTCGDFNVDGTVRHAATSWPYATGDIQWTSLNFTYGTVEIRAKFPSQSASLWPATWLLGSNCQATNPFTADTGYAGCPNLASAGYTEIDMTECYGGGCQFHVANPGFGPQGTACDLYYQNAVDANWHTFTTMWSPTGIKQYMDGMLQTSCSQSLNNPMFLLMQTQTGGSGGTPNNSLLPATLMIDYVKVTQP
jgi:beta-glucanase (GH16 family)